MRNFNDEYFKTHPSQLTDQLFLSAARAVTSKCLLDLGITSIINATLELPTVAYQKQEAIQIAVEDRIASKLYIYFDLVADKIQQVHLAGGKIMVYCRAGQSRSATLCMAYFMKYHGLSYDEAFQYVRERRRIVHPNIGFIRQLKEYEQKLKLKGSVSSLAIAATPAVARRHNANTPVPLPIPLSASENSIGEDEEEEDLLVHQPEDFAVQPPRCDLALITFHDQYKETAENFQVQVVNLCDKISTATPALDHPSASYHNPQPVADTGLEQTGESTGVFDPTLRRSKSRRTAFTRLSKPNEIAVSFINLSLELAIISNRITPFKLHINKEYCSTSEFTELHEAYEVLEEVPDECLTHTPPLGSTGGHPGEMKPHSIVSKLLQCPTYSFHVSCLDLDSYSTSKDTVTKKQTVMQSVAKKPALKRPPLTLGRSWNVNNSSLFGPKSTSVPKKAKSAAQVSRAERNTCQNFLTCASESSLSFTWETCIPFQSRVAMQKSIQVKPRTVIEAFKSVIITQPCVLYNCDEYSTSLKTADVYHKLDFSITDFNTCCMASCLSNCLLGNENTEFGRKMRMTRQYPYYTLVKLQSAIEMVRATEEIKLKTQWFQPLKPERRKSEVKLMRSESTSKKNKRSVAVPEIALNWASDDYISTKFSTTLDMADHVWTERIASKSPVDRICTSYNETETITFYKTDLIGRFYVPYYDPRVLRKNYTGDYLGVGVVQQPLLLEMNNLYSNPKCKFLTVNAKESFHKDFLSLASTFELHDDKQEFTEDIPDEIVDLNWLKLVLSNEKSEAKCNIWLDVFKRTVMKLKPTFARQSYLDPLATVISEIITSLEFPTALLPNSFAHEVARCTRIANTILLSPTFLSVNCFDNVEEFSSLKKIKVKSEPFMSKVKVADTYVIECQQESWDIAQSFQGSYNQSLLGHASSCVSFPNRLYSVSSTDVMGSSRPYSAAEEHNRTAFQIVSRLHGVVSHQTAIHLTCTADLPAYQFVQDVEDWPDRVVHSDPVLHTPCVEEVTTLWFFALDSVTKVAEETPSNFLLFLPDQEQAGLIGQMDIEGNTDVNVVNPSLVVDEVLQEISDDKIVEDIVSNHKDFLRVQEAEVKRQVSFSEDVQKPKSKVKTIYYGRDRSKSRQRLKDAHLDNNSKPRRNRSASRHNEAEILNNLSKSVNEANNILTRRREIGRYDGPASPLVRGRERERLPPRYEDEMYERPSRMESGEGRGSPPKLLGFANLAQKATSLFTRGPALDDERPSRSNISRRSRKF